MISLVNHMNILVIEDEQLLSGSLRELLAQHGFAAEAAYDGPLGLELALTGVYDLIILDVMLPGVDGLDMLRRIRQTPGMRSRGGCARSAWGRRY